LLARVGDGSRRWQDPEVSKIVRCYLLQYLDLRCYLFEVWPHLPPSPLSVV
jgi:hypothetical protein